VPKNTYRICLLFIFFINIKMTQYIYHYNPEYADPSHVFVFATEANGLLKNGYGPAARKYHGAPLKKPMGFSQTEKGKVFGVVVKDSKGFHLRTMDILRNVDMFLEYSLVAKGETFHITNFAMFLPRVAPGVIARMFVGAHKNCIFPVEWQEFLEPPDKAQILL
jgi:hypothetical protein